MITVAVANHSSLTKAEVEAICQALSDQATHHIAPAWRTQGAKLLLRAPAVTDWQMLFLEDSDQEGALGYHDDETSHGLPRMKVFVKDCEADGISPSSCASHELAEALVDPYLTTANFDGASKFWATEIGDPAQASTYEIGGVEVQDFVTPQWFGAPGSQFDHTHTITRPFQVPKGGYAQFLDINHPGNGWQEVGFELGAGHSRPSRRKRNA